MEIWNQHICEYTFLTKHQTLKTIPQEMLLRKGILKICSKFTREYPWWSVDSIKLQTNLLKLHFSIGVFTQIAAYFQNTFLQEYFRVTSAKPLKQQYHTPKFKGSKKVNKR